MTEPQSGAEAQTAPETPPEVQPQAAPEVQAQAAPEVQAQAAPEDTFSDHPEVGEIIVDDHNRPFLVLDVNKNDGSVIGLAFNVDGTSEVVTEHADNGD